MVDSNVVDFEIVRVRWEQNLSLNIQFKVRRKVFNLHTHSNLWTVLPFLFSQSSGQLEIIHKHHQQQRLVALAGNDERKITYCKTNGLCKDEYIFTLCCLKFVQELNASFYGSYFKFLVFTN